MTAGALAALVLAAAGPRLETSVAVGAGYDSNLNHAGSGRDAVGGEFTAVRASGGASVELGEATSLYGGLRLDVEQYPGVSDLSTGTAGVEAALVRDLGGSWALVLAPSAGKSWAGDPTRDATVLAAQATLRVKPLRDLALRAFYGHTTRVAADPVFSSERDRVGASVEWRTLARTYLSVAYAAERGPEVLYAPSGGGGFPGMGGPMVSAFGRNEQAYRVDAVSQSVTPALEVGLGAAFHLLGSYEVRLVRTDAADFVAHSAFVGLGLRL